MNIEKILKENDGYSVNVASSERDYTFTIRGGKLYKNFEGSNECLECDKFTTAGFIAATGLNWK